MQGTSPFSNFLVFISYFLLFYITKERTLRTDYEQRFVDEYIYITYGNSPIHLPLHEFFSFALHLFQEVTHTEREKKQSNGVGRVVNRQSNKVKTIRETESRKVGKSPRMLQKDSLKD